MLYAVNPERRRFFGAAAMTLAATQLDVSTLDAAQIHTSEAPKAAPAKAARNSSFASLKQIDAGLLNVSYAEAGPHEGTPVVLLHGWPYDIHSFIDVARLLASAGYRVIVPYTRGYGTTRFLSDKTFRNAQPSVGALDIIALMDALNIKSAIIGGFDWGGRTADIIAVLWPKRCRGLVSVSGYLMTSQAAQKNPLPPTAELCHGTRPRRLRQILVRFREAYLEDRFTEMGLR
jgi:pimeloyl-ACP methyl ester carboxylesterase